MSDSATFEKMPPPQKTSAQLVAVSVWVLGIALLFQFSIFPSTHDTWLLLWYQLTAYGLLALPVIVFRSNMSAWFQFAKYQVLGGCLLVAAAMTYAEISLHREPIQLLTLTIRMVVTGVIEELVFRGFIYDKTAILTKRILTIFVVNTLLFTAFHVPAVLAQHENGLVLLEYAILGTIFCVLKLTSKSLTLPTLLHIALNVASV